MVTGSFRVQGKMESGKASSGGRSGRWCLGGVWAQGQAREGTDAKQGWLEEMEGQVPGRTWGARGEGAWAAHQGFTSDGRSWGSTLNAAGNL